MQMFFKIDVSQKLRDRKTLVLDSLFNTVGELNLCNFMVKRLHHSCFPMNIHVEYCKIFENSFLYRTPPVAAFASLLSVIGHLPTFLLLIKNTMWHDFY